MAPSVKLGSIQEGREIYMYLFEYFLSFASVGRFTSFAISRCYHTLACSCRETILPGISRSNSCQFLTISSRTAALSTLDDTASSWEMNALSGSSIAEPADLVSRTFIHQATRQTSALLCLEDLLQNVLLASSSRNETNLCGVQYHGQAEGDAGWWRLGRVFEMENPGVLFSEQRVIGKEGAGVSVWTAAQEDQVEEWQLHRVAHGKATDQSLLVVIRQLLWIVEEFGVDRIDSRLSILLRNLVEQI